MLEPLNQTLADPHASHAAFVHAAIVLPVIGWLAAIVAAVFAFKSRPTLIAAAALMLGGSFWAGLAAGVGEEAESNIRDGSDPPLTQPESDALDAHAALGEGGWMWSAAPAALLAGACFIPKRKNRARIAVGAAAVIASTVTVTWVVRTGHTGGQLVYVHGLGVPDRTATPTPP